ncbi:MAG: hypothetical protein IPO08_23450 [Xanthomonadales bacterium]|nr:hypothetical protein [Xanthomonadales bacterium]
MRVIAIDSLSSILMDNINQKLTSALASGIASMLNQILINEESRQQPAVDPAGSPVADG